MRRSSRRGGRNGRSRGRTGSSSSTSGHWGATPSGAGASIAAPGSGSSRSVSGEDRASEPKAQTGSTLVELSGLRGRKSAERPVCSWPRSHSEHPCAHPPKSRCRTRPRRHPAPRTAGVVDHRRRGGRRRADRGDRGLGSRGRLRERGPDARRPARHPPDGPARRGPARQTYAELVTSRPVLEAARKRLGLQTSVSQLRADVRATADDVTRLLTITARQGTAGTLRAWPPSCPRSSPGPRAGSSARRPRASAPARSSCGSSTPRRRRAAPSAATGTR